MDADPETSLLIANLILDDISEIENRRKGKNRHDAPQTDEELSLSLQERHLRDLLSNIRDFQFAQGLDRALSSDLRLINALSIAERAAHDDRAAALALSEERPLPAQTPSQRHVETMKFASSRASQSSSRGDRPTPSSSTPAYGFHPASSPPTTRPSTMATTSPVYGFRPAPAESVVSAGSSRPTSVYRSNIFVTSTAPAITPARRRECVSCMENIQRGGITGLCGHDYCSGCIVDLVTTCTKDESLYPLRCCGQNLDERQILASLGNARLTAEFQSKAREFATPALQRVYCPQPTCSAFLGTTWAIALPSFSLPSIKNEYGELWLHFGLTMTALVIDGNTDMERVVARNVATTYPSIYCDVKAARCWLVYDVLVIGLGKRMSVELQDTIQVIQVFVAGAESHQPIDLQVSFPRILDLSTPGTRP
ncbi:hypothetical protein ONZ45_g11245 [Pleurotus djamor]|nr:hypothetical protein ONZ45_g11245 [Pleurotus djamor]